MRASNYDKYPTISVSNSHGSCVTGWEASVDRLRQAVAQRAAAKTILVVECYCGVAEEQILREFARRLSPVVAISAKEALLPSKKIETLIAPFLGGNDPVFGFMSDLTLPQFFDAGKVEQFRHQAGRPTQGLVLIVGAGATLIAPGDILVYADLARWEAQNRFRRGETCNLGFENLKSPANLQYKQAFFVDWRVCDRWKQPLISRWDFLLDTNSTEPKLAEAETVRRGLRQAVTRPFRVVPFFDPAPWGGQWMKEVCAVEGDAPNYGWCFDCVPEENSLLLALGGVRIEIPALDLVFHQTRALLGGAVERRFGAEFPIRFDFLDTMSGGNLSFQVHPSTEYIHRTFGMSYTQDESYYLLDAASDATVYLGVKTGVDPATMLSELESAQNGGKPFDADRYANRWPARKHDHFLIPAGTVHCSGANAMVLEISATPYIFTFKLWDWGRLGLDGKPRPIHLNHGREVIRWERDTEWTRRELINQIRNVGSADGWREERTGLHLLEFIETRRHWFTKPVRHNTNGGVNVLNLVQGHEAVVESPDSAFDPFPIHYAETFIIPAAVGPYIIRPASQDELATVKAYVRT